MIGFDGGSFMRQAGSVAIGSARVSCTQPFVRHLAGTCVALVSSLEPFFQALRRWRFVTFCRACCEWHHNRGNIWRMRRWRCQRDARVVQNAPEAPQPGRTDGSVQPTTPSVPPDSKLDRKMTLLRRSGLFESNTRGARIARAATLEDLRQAYKLVHRVYLGTSYIEPEAGDMRLRIFETSSDTATFVAKFEGRVVGVLSVIRDTPEVGLPSDNAFKEELDVLRAQGKRLCEVTNQAIEPEFRKTALPTEFMRCALAHILNSGLDLAIAAVSPSHHGFYDLIGFRKIGSERSYSEKLHDPVISMSLDMERFRNPAPAANVVDRFVFDYLSAENPFFGYVDIWERHARRQFLDVELLQQLFVTERNFVAECSPAELEILHDRWGRELFSAVTADLFLPALHSLDWESRHLKSGHHHSEGKSTRSAEQITKRSRRAEGGKAWRSPLRRFWRIRLKGRQ